MNNARTAVIGFLVALVGILGWGTVFTVSETEQALVLQFGEPMRVIKEPGLHFKLPVAQDVSYFDKLVLEFDANAEEVPTKDQKQLVVDAYARYRIVDPLLFYQKVSTEFGMQQRLGKVINASLRSVIGNVSLAIVLSEKRSGLVQEIADRVAKEGTPFGIEVLDVRIKHMDLPEENSQAIFRRMQTQREQEARRIRAVGQKESQLIRADADKQGAVIEVNAQRESEELRGLGDAEAQKIYNEAYGQDREFYDFWHSLKAMEAGLSQGETRFIGSPDSDNAFFRYFGDMSGGLQKKSE